MDPSVRNLCVRSMTQLNGVLLSLRFIVFGLFDNHQRPADEESRGWCSVVDDRARRVGGLCDRGKFNRHSD